MCQPPKERTNLPLSPRISQMVADQVGAFAFIRVIRGRTRFLGIVLERPSAAAANGGRSDWPQKGPKSVWDSGEKLPCAYRRDARYRPNFRFLGPFCDNKISVIPGWFTLRPLEPTESIVSWRCHRHCKPRLPLGRKTFHLGSFRGRISLLHSHRRRRAHRFP